jgi:hypothetical protein
MVKYKIKKGSDCLGVIYYAIYEKWFIFWFCLTIKRTNEEAIEFVNEMRSPAKQV